MRFRSLIGGMLAGAALLAAVPADAKSCQELVADKSYRCTTASPGVEGTTDVCARFLTTSTGILLLVDGLEAMPCACEHSGSISRPRFGESAEFACIGGGTVITGKATKTKIDKVFSREVRGGEVSAGTCVLDTICSLSD